MDTVMTVVGLVLFLLMLGVPLVVFLDDLYRWWGRRR